MTDEFDSALTPLDCKCASPQSDAKMICLTCGGRTYDDDDISREETFSGPSPFLPEIVQRPNAVIRNGGPQLLRGLMLPLPPSANAYWRSMPMVKKGTVFPLYIRSFKELYTRIRAITFPSDAAKDYVKTIKELAIQRGFMFNTEKPLRVDIVVCPRDRREVDAHNYEKVLLDAFQQAQVYADDSQIIDVRTRLGPIIKGGRVVVSMCETQHDPDAVLKEAWG